MFFLRGSSLKFQHYGLCKLFSNKKIQIFHIHIQAENPRFYGQIKLPYLHRALQPLVILATWLLHIGAAQKIQEN
jgi:hypothetical protein